MNGDQRILCIPVGQNEVYGRVVRAVIGVGRQRRVGIGFGLRDGALPLDFLLACLFVGTIPNRRFRSWTGAQRDQQILLRQPRLQLFIGLFGLGSQAWSGGVPRVVRQVVR